MGEPKGKFTSGNICCIGVGQQGVLVSTVVAHMCPNVVVSVVDLKPEKITLWNTKQILFSDSKLEEMLKHSQNRNLVFTTNTENAIKDADIIFILLDSPDNQTTYQNKKVLDLTGIEEAIRLIAKKSENNKIVAIKNTVPVGTGEFFKSILQKNKANGIELQILSFPECFGLGDGISSYLNPEKILLGSDLSPKGIKAVETISSVFSWVPSTKIIQMSTKSAELSKIAESALQAQRISNMSVIFLICEKLGADSSEVQKILGEYTKVFLETSRPAVGFGISNIRKHVTYLVELCEGLKLHESAEFWREVLTMNEYQEKRFFKKILSAFFNNLNQKKIAIWGLECSKYFESLNESLATDLCRNLALEGAKLNIYDPRREGRQLMYELKAVGLEENREVFYCDDPYKAARKADAIILLSNLEDMDGIDYNVVYRDMAKPARIFDSRSCLPHKKLIKIGFHVETVGKTFQQDKTFQYL